MYSKSKPFMARIVRRRLLNGDESTKKTYHVELDISGSGLSFKPGDSIGVLPQNGPFLVDAILERLKVKGTEQIVEDRSGEEMTLREFFLYRANLTKVNSSFLKLFSPLLGDLFNPEKKAELKAFLQTTTVYDIVAGYSPSLATHQDLCKPILPLMPRFYSIASSPCLNPNRIDLLVSYVSYVHNDRKVRGVGSHFLCETAESNATPIPIYLQPAKHFALPENPATPIIMVGPGTGIAPYRAFLQERKAQEAKGLNWLFFGERNRKTDFYYADYLTELANEGFLRLTTAFSRDQVEKIYVQHKLFEHRRDIWDLLQKGAYFYVCGDALRMAKDVDLTLQQIAKEEGKMSKDEARQFVKSLRHEKRYQTDVY